ncbi:type I glutamate--ammonia ligase [Candidatus Dojkabacteria bacterium]|uniref:Glutamine synthetase n=1 Tax=Candidatus Dojkabacteria bacterium TaxID=2099670 RepID=A0A955L814_9BACT|nr:type I glutamate--ammonia ligase [Candidatus Dojkabacteria bacterium]
MLSFAELSKYISSGDVDFIDLLFVDIRGTIKRKTIHAREFTKDAIAEGYGFDGSSLPGFKTIFESDMIVRPDLDTIFLDPFSDRTAAVFCDIYDPITKKPYELDPRFIAKRAEKYIRDTKIATDSYWGPELEFFVFRSVEVDASPYLTGVTLSSEEARDADGMSGYEMHAKKAYFTTSPFDTLGMYRNEVSRIAESIGIQIEAHHHEVATAGQIEINMKYTTLLRMADNVLLLKYIARNVAKEYGLTAIFLPKPVYDDNGTGMHIHHSLFKDDKNIFADDKGYAGLSKEAVHYIGGILEHIYPLLAFTNPTPNSYRRLVPHFEAPTAVAYSQRNRSAAIRVPLNIPSSPKARRFEFRCPDATSNPYYAFAAIAVAGIDGLKKKLDPEKLGYGPFDKDIWEMDSVKQTPRKLDESLSALADSSLFIESKVFSKAFIESYLEVVTESYMQAELHPTPADFHYYSDI